MDIKEFLTWLATSVGASAALSFLAERSPIFERLTSRQKAWAMLAGSLIVALVAYAIITYTPPDTLAQITPYFQIAYGVIATWMANQIAHKADPQA